MPSPPLVNPLQPYQLEGHFERHIFLPSSQRLLVDLSVNYRLPMCTREGGKIFLYPISAACTSQYEYESDLIDFFSYIFPHGRGFPLEVALMSTSNNRVTNCVT